MGHGSNLNFDISRDSSLIASDNLFWSNGIQEDKNTRLQVEIFYRYIHDFFLLFRFGRSTP